MSKQLIRYILLAFVLLFSFSIQSCKKFLDAKPDPSLVIPDGLDDLQAILDDPNRINRSDPFSAEVSCDNYFVLNAELISKAENLQRIHRWEKDFLFPNSATNDWAQCYNMIYVANTVLDNIVNIPRISSNALQWDNIKGQALMIRARSFQLASIIWTLAYDPNTAETDLGLPLRLNSDFNQPSVRANLKDTYDQIIRDFKEAIQLLPIIPVKFTRGSKPAALAFLARTYLAMTNYDSALIYSEKCLQLKDTLLDYNNTSVSKTGSGAAFLGLSPTSNPTNPEILFNSRASLPTIMTNTSARIDTTLYASYDANDLRKTVFFNITPGPPAAYRFRGSYDGTASPFTAIATDEVYLMRAECHARLGNKISALADLNALMKKRWKNNSVPAFVPIDAPDAATALTKILIERRKELVFRGLRWMDLKRLNKEGANIVLKRVVAQTYTLPPNDLRYALALPEDVISISGMPQNPR